MTIRRIAYFFILKFICQSFRNLTVFHFIQRKGPYIDCFQAKPNQLFLFRIFTIYISYRIFFVVLFIHCCANFRRSYDIIHVHGLIYSEPIYLTLALLDIFAGAIFLLVVPLGNFVIVLVCGQILAQCQRCNT